MLEKSSQLRKHLQGNPLALHLAPFAASLRENGYTGGTLQWKLVSLAGFGRWLRKTGRGVAHLDQQRKYPKHWVVLSQRLCGFQ